jgi:hypothetical protein
MQMPWWHPQDSDVNVTAQGSSIASSDSHGPPSYGDAKYPFKAHGWFQVFQGSSSS